MTIFHNVKGKIERNSSKDGYSFVFDHMIYPEPGSGAVAAEVHDKLIDLLRSKNYQLHSRILATVEIPKFVGGQNQVIELYFSKKKQ